jgi:hypothetical protein
MSETKLYIAYVGLEYHEDRWYLGVFDDLKAASDCVNQYRDKGHVCFGDYPKGFYFGVAEFPGINMQRKVTNFCGSGWGMKFTEWEAENERN